MTEHALSGALLGRLMEHRRLDVAALSRSAGLAEGEDEDESGSDSVLSGALRGDGPGPSVLRRLAPALGLHTADLFVIAGAEVPDDLAPVDPRAGSDVHRLVRIGITLPPEQPHLLRTFVASMPQEGRVLPPLDPWPPAVERYPHGPGALLMRLLRNRNLGWTATAKTFLVATGRYWSPATYGGIGRGTVPLTAELLTDFCAVLDVPAADLAALTGLTPAHPPSTCSAPGGVSGLVWEVRRLTTHQLGRAIEFAETLGH
ncbi:hypothetical protein ACWCWD_18050 [Streptomyces sp. NPDC001493]